MAKTLYCKEKYNGKYCKNQPLKNRKICHIHYQYQNNLYMNMILASFLLYVIIINDTRFNTIDFQKSLGKYLLKLYNSNFKIILKQYLVKLYNYDFEITLKDTLVKLHNIFTQLSSTTLYNYDFEITLKDTLVKLHNIFTQLSSTTLYTIDKIDRNMINLHFQNASLSAINYYNTFYVYITNTCKFIEYTN